MPVRIQGRLLAELGTLLGLCLAAAGCQSSVVRNDGAPPSLFGSNVQSPLLSYLRGERSSDGTSATQGQVVSMLRPVAVETDNSRVPAVSGWSPIQRTSGEVVAGASPGILNVDAQLQPNLEQPGQLGQPTPLVPQTVVEPPLVEGAHGMPMHALGMYAPRELDKRSYPAYIIEPPDIIEVQSTKGLLDQPVKLLVPVGMDGTLNLGTYGSVYVAGLTVDGAREAVANQLSKRVKDLDVRNVSVTVAAYNSKVYYIIADGGGYGEQVARFPATGNETVLDALAQIGGLPTVASKKHIWVARATPGDATHPQIMPVDWIGITQRGSAATNFQIFPGDRIYVSSDPWVRKDTWIARRLAPLQNILGTVLLGSTTVNSIKGRGLSNNAP